VLPGRRPKFFQKRDADQTDPVALCVSGLAARSRSRAIEADLNDCLRRSPPYVRGNTDNAPEKIMTKRLLFSTVIAGFLVASASIAQAESAYDGSWDLNFVTQRGACETTSFTVNINDGVVTHPNLVRFKGHVARSGSVRASVTVQDRFASGSGRLAGNSGRGSWSGYSGQARCSGYWTARRN
jgi:hypothetical protein